MELLSDVSPPEVVFNLSGTENVSPSNFAIYKSIFFRVSSNVSFFKIGSFERENIIFTFPSLSTAETLPHRHPSSSICFVFPQLVPS